MDAANACFGAHPKSQFRMEKVTRKFVLDLFDMPLPNLLVAAQETHRKHFDPLEIRASTLVSIKTGACVEDRAYCAQSSHHHESVPYQPLMDVEDVLEAGRSGMPHATQLLCFLAGANGIFLGGRLLTAENPSRHEDKAMIESFGMVLRTEN